MPEIIRGIKKRITPIIILFLPQIAIDVYLVLDKTMIGIFASGIDQVGYYSQAQKIVKLVLAIVTSLGTVMLPAMSSAFAKGDHEGIKKSIKISFRFVYMLSFALLFGLVAVAPQFVPVFFGEGYAPVVPLMIIISPILVIIATSNVVGRQYLLPTNQQRFFTISIVAGACVNFILNIVFISLWDAFGASIATVIAELTVTAVQCVFVRKQLPLIECMSSGVRYAIFGAVMFAVVRCIGTVFNCEGILGLVILIVAGVLTFGAELIVFRDPMVKLFIELLKKRKSMSH